jgi:glycosyltransferase involved in cell wall biosynthesis
MSRTRRLRITSFPNPFPGNPYLTLFYDHLRENGVDYVRSDHFGQSWLRENRGEIDYLHFHWPSFDYSDASGRRSVLAMTRFLLKMRAARLMGYKIIWTMHNLYPHERQNANFEWLCRFAFVQSVDLVFVNFPAAQEDLWRRFRRRRGVHVVPHGSYAPLYPQRPDRAAARLELGIEPDAYVFLVFGQVRPYKGADIAARALARLDDPGYRLYIVGQHKDDAHSEELRVLAARDPRVRLVLTPDNLPDERVGLWLAASDCVAAPYRDVYTSGVAYLAATFGKPIVAPRLGIFRSLGDLSFVRRFEPEGGDAAVGAAFEAVRGTNPEDLVESARRFTAEHDWGVITARVAEILSTSR